MSNILYIAYLNSEKEKYDGERIKSTFIYDSLKKKANVDVINLSVHKLFNTFRIFWCALFKKKKYDLVIISKDPHGANIIQKILKFVKYPSSKINYFEIGPFLYDRILNGSIKKETFIKDKLIVVETLSMKNELVSLGFDNIDVFPNFKPVYSIKFNEQKYPKDTLNLVYLSRIEEQKGIYDLIDCLKVLNKDKLKFRLDIYGRPQTKFDEDKLNQLVAGCEYINYLGKIDINCAEAYEQLSKYDLHVFPTKYSEGFPGTIIDFFIAGVPTLASTFARSNDILKETDSILFKQFDNEDLSNKLKYIYSNQNILSKLRKESFKRSNKYSIEAFDLYLEKVLK